MTDRDNISENSHDPRIDFFDRIAPLWDEDEQDPLDTVHRMDGLVDLVSFQKGDDLLEVGCGTGQLTGWLVEHVAPGKVVAIDFSEAMLAKISKKGHDAKILKADACDENLSAVLDDARFDQVLCFHSFPHFRDQGAALAILAGLLKPGGFIRIMHLKSPEEINNYHRSVDGIVSIDLMPEIETDWDELFGSVGLEKFEWIKQDDLFVISARPK
jgi:ubiquinone/menaquinone biosynthesis C-methylase UbiE